MKFSGGEVPGSLFKLARDRMLLEPTVTPDAVRAHLLTHGLDDLKAASGIVQNHKIIANRVFWAACRELVAAGEIEQLKRGVWAKTSFLAAANASSD